MQFAFNGFADGGDSMMESRWWDLERQLAPAEWIPSHLGRRLMTARPAGSARCAGWPTTRNQTQRRQAVMPYRIRNDGAPARNHTAIMLSKIMQPNAEVGMNGQMGLPHK
jgi:hypothetical protein